MTNDGTFDETSRWSVDAAAYDAWFDRTWGRYADPTSLAVARTRVTGELVEGDVHRLPFDDARFDVARRRPHRVTGELVEGDVHRLPFDDARFERGGGDGVRVRCRSQRSDGRARSVNPPRWASGDRQPATVAMARSHGTTTWRHGLYAPAVLPGLATWGPLLERIGRRIAPRHAAFKVLTITLPEHPTAQPGVPPFVTTTDHDEPSVFQVENLLREARRQRNLGSTPVPTVCLLDPDGDVVRHLAPLGRATRHSDWACYHSELWTTHHDRLEIGIVPCAVGAPYAVLVAEELAASGCRCGSRGTRTIRPSDLRPHRPRARRRVGPEIARDFTDASMPFEVRRLGRTIAKWAAQIVAWHQSHVSNGPTEAIDNLVKRVKRTAFGFRRFEHYRIRALLYAGKPNWSLLNQLTPP